MSEPIRLIVVDHNTLLRRCLVAVLNRRRDLDVVGEAACGVEAVEVARTQHPDVVLLEPAAPECGLPLIRRLRHEMPDSGLLVLSMCSDNLASQALQFGARGFIEKTCEPDDLVRAIKQVHAGELVVGSGAVDLVLEKLNGSTDATPVCGVLTPREIDVLKLVAAGRTNPEIARELYITEHTVKGHLARILGKLGLDNRVQLAIYAIQQNMVDNPSGADQSLH